MKTRAALLQNARGGLINTRTASLYESENRQGRRSPPERMNREKPTVVTQCRTLTAAVLLYIDLVNPPKDTVRKQGQNITVGVGRVDVHVCRCKSWVTLASLRTARAIHPP